MAYKRKESLDIGLEHRKPLCYNDKSELVYYLKRVLA